MSKSKVEEILPVSVKTRRTMDVVIKEYSKITRIDIGEEEYKLLYDRQKHTINSETPIPYDMFIDNLTLTDIAIFSILANKYAFGEWEWYYVFDFGYYVLALKHYDEKAEKVLDVWIYEMFLWRLFKAIYVYSDVVRIKQIAIDQRELYNNLHSVIDAYKKIVEMILRKKKAIKKTKSGISQAPISSLAFA